MKRIYIVPQIRTIILGKEDLICTSVQMYNGRQGNRSILNDNSDGNLTED